MSKVHGTLDHMAKLLNIMRTAIRDSNESRYRIAQNTGIAESVLSRFIRGETGLSVETLERLAKYLDLEITVRRKQPRTRRDG